MKSSHKQSTPFQRRWWRDKRTIQDDNIHILFTEKSLDIAHANNVNKMASEIDQHETTVGVFLYLSKAFALDHHILSAKSEH